MRGGGGQPRGRPGRGSAAPFDAPETESRKGRGGVSVSRDATSNSG